MNFIKGKFSALKSGISNIFSSIKRLASNIWNNIWGTIKEIASNIWNFVTDKFDSMKDKVGNIFDSIYSTAKSIFNNIKDAITDPIDKAVGVVKRLVGKIKSAMDFNFKLPKLKMPHIDVDMRKNSFGIPYPDFDVSWYAKGGVFNGSSVIGVGEEPGVSEAVIPLKSSVLGKIGSMIASTMQNGSLNTMANFDPSTLFSTFERGISNFSNGFVGNGIDSLYGEQQNGGQTVIKLNPTINMNVKDAFDTKKHGKEIANNMYSEISRGLTKRGINR